MEEELKRLKRKLKSLGYTDEEIDDILNDIVTVPEDTDWI